MKNACIFIVALTFVVVSVRADIIYPDGKAPTSNPYEVNKLSRGLANIILAPIEIPRAIFRAGRDNGITSTQQTATGALTEGPYKMFLRIGSGVYDLGTLGQNDDALLHMEPDELSLFDVIPGYTDQFLWETIDTPAGATSR